MHTLDQHRAYIAYLGTIVSYLEAQRRIEINYGSIFLDLLSLQHRRSRSNISESFFDPFTS
jgi:hypothetical protein